MSKAAFPANDLLRRKLQTALTVITLTLSVASTLFLLLFSSRLGVGISAAKSTLTLGLTAVFSQFIFFIGILIFAVGAILTSFIVFLMMAQRTRDFGLIKAAGCPNSLVAGYFATELLIVTFTGCILGVAFGFLIDYAVANLVFSTYILPNFWFAPLIFIVFFVLAVVFGFQPIFKASKMTPIKALSPVNYYGMTIERKHKTLSTRRITWRIASRSLARRQSATVRIVLLLSIVFVLLTVVVAGGIIASGTTIAWIQQPTSKNTIVIAHSSMENQYKSLLLTFSKTQENRAFNYTDSQLMIPDAVVNQLESLSGVKTVDSRLVLNESISEIANFTFVGEENSATRSVGDHRQGASIIVGVNPANLVESWTVKGHFLSENDSFRAVVGDSISNSMYARASSQELAYSNPLLEGALIRNSAFDIVGVCIDPLNNGRVTYVPIKSLENVTGLSGPNLLFVNLDNSTDPVAASEQIKTLIQSADPDLNVFTLNDIYEENTNFLSSNWQTIMLLPFFTLTSAALCLVGYMMLAAEEQRQEFGVLRAVGAKPRLITNILAIQSLIVLLSSFAVGVPLGVMITLVILIAQPLVTSVTILVIAGILFAALAVMFLLSLYPAFRLAKSEILKIMA
jgi:ABC-type antimicrobial peptide transport system permease subunit